LATGSGAVFSSGAFASATASSTADIGVVVEGDLVVEAGASFRNNSGKYISSRADGEFYGDGTDDLFDSLDDDSGSAEQFDNGTISVDELPAARVNGGSTRQSDKDLDIQVAMPSHQDNGDPLDHRFDELLQVSNEGTEPAEVGIKYSEYGEDANSEGGNIPNHKIRDAFKFLRSDGSVISPTKGDTDNKNSVEVGVGETKQIWLDIDLSKTGTVSTDIATDIASAAEPDESDVFSGGDYDTVDILDQVQFGDELDDGN
jgi:hypothetical protein